MANIIKKAYDVFHRYFVELPSDLSFAERVFLDDSKTYLITNDHIGDFLIAMGYLRAFREYYHVKHLVLCTSPKMKSIALRYTIPEDEILCFDRPELQKLLFLPRIKSSYEWFMKKGNVWFACPVDFQPVSFDYYLSAFPGMTLRHVIQHACLHLPDDAIFQPMPILEEHVSKRKPAIILCPASQNRLWTDYAPKDFFEKLVEVLGKYDTDLYLNIGPHDPVGCIPAVTKPLHKSLEELGDWIVPGDIVIGIRSGIMDFFSYFDCNIICLYAPIRWFASFYTLDMLPGKRCHYVEHILDGAVDYCLKKVQESVDNYMGVSS